jgi:hypothetical protein
MEQVEGKACSCRRGNHGALAGTQAADARALALLPTIRELMAALMRETPSQRTPGLIGHGQCKATSVWPEARVSRYLMRLPRE